MKVGEPISSTTHLCINDTYNGEVSFQGKYSWCLKYEVVSSRGMQQIRLPEATLKGLKQNSGDLWPDVSEESTASPSSSGTPKARVRFNSSANSVHPITPYAEIYGAHPRTFHFDSDGNKIRTGFGPLSSAEDEVSVFEQICTAYNTHVGSSALLASAAGHISSLYTTCTSVWEPLKSFANLSCTGSMLPDVQDMKTFTSHKSCGWPFQDHHMNIQTEVDLEIHEPNNPNAGLAAPQPTPWSTHGAYI